MLYQPFNSPLVIGFKSAPFGGVIPGVAVIQAGIVIVIVTPVADGVGVSDGVVGGLGRNSAVAPGIVQILGYHIAVDLIYILPNILPAVKKNAAPGLDAA